MHGSQLSLCHKEPARSKQKPLVGGFGCDELVLYGIRVLAEQLLGKVLDIEVDHTVSGWEFTLTRTRRQATTLGTLTASLKMKHPRRGLVLASLAFGLTTGKIHAREIRIQKKSISNIV